MTYNRRNILHLLNDLTQWVSKLKSRRFFRKRIQDTVEDIRTSGVDGLELIAKVYLVRNYVTELRRSKHREYFLTRLQDAAENADGLTGVTRVKAEDVLPGDRVLATEGYRLPYVETVKKLVMRGRGERVLFIGGDQYRNLELHDVGTTVLVERDLKKQIIRLGYSKPDLRPHLRPILENLDMKRSSSYTPYTGALHRWNGRFSRGER